ncbi:MAG: ribonuclease D [Chloroflexi bacterium]|nr:MAG: ribonuclease D [Chloroflexota bacterium]
MSSPTMNQPDFKLVDDNQSMKLMAKQVSNESIVALDLEANGMHRYPERVCLIQLAIPNNIYIIDPLSNIDMSPICDIVENSNIEKIMHAVSYDVRCLKREWGIKINNLFDPAIAASFLGIKKTGLASVIEEILGIKIDKSKKLQRSDWTVRPLSSKSLIYAANDVAHLINLGLELKERLKVIGRYDWVQEEFQRQVTATFKSMNPGIDLFAVKGGGRVDMSKIPVLRSLSKLRIKYAVLHDKPLYKIFTDKTLVELSNADPSVALNCKGLGIFAFAPLNNELLNAIHRGLQSPPFYVPSKSRPPLMQPDQKKRLELLKFWRINMGAELNIDPSLVWPAPSLERIAMDTTLIKNEINSSEVRRWQVKAFLKNLSVFIQDNGLNR